MRGIAAELGKRKLETPRGGSWHPQLVKHIIERLAGTHYASLTSWRRLGTKLGTHTEPHAKG
jgi:hypothetical protein